ncbi:MAG TPA: cytochrome c [Polyangiaceae bacterium]|nr:cytochrome c [Polyangiaceae bacterium]
MSAKKRRGLLWLAALAALACTARPPTAVPGIEPDQPDPGAQQVLARPAAWEPTGDPELVASGTDAARAEREDGGFVASRQPPSERARARPQLPIHIYARWWPWRASHLHLSEAQVQRRDEQLSRVRAPAGFWDAQTSLEAVSVWTVLCNECHGGRRTLEDAAAMPPPGPEWGQREGLFFGNRRSYEHLFDVVEHGGPPTKNGLARMPSWGGILSREMIWALLYFLEYQSGGIESRFPPSLYPRPPRVPTEP